MGHNGNTWTHTDEIKFIKSLDSQRLRKYRILIHERSRWGSIDKNRVIKFLDRYEV